VGVSWHYVQDVEYGKKFIESSSTLRKLAAILDIPLWKFGLSEYDPFDPQDVSRSGTSTAADSCIKVIETHLDEQRDGAITRDERLDTRVYLMEEETPPVTPEVENADMNRQGFLDGAARVVGTTLFTPAYDLLSYELAGRFFSALKKPSTIDEDFLYFLYKCTDTYWRERDTASFASSPLLRSVLEHFEKLLVLLEGPLLPTVRTHLCSLLGATALLVGHLFYDLGRFAQAREYYKVAMTAAQEAHNLLLQAVAWGRMSHAWLYNGNVQIAFTCVQEAHRLVTPTGNFTIRAWVSALEAEVQAKLGDQDACLMALDGAECLADQQFLREDCYWINFDRSLLAGYQGACFQQLYRAEDLTTHHFLEDARQALIDALSRLDLALLRRQPIYLADIAGTFVLQGEIEEACDHVIQALMITARMKSQPVMLRILATRRQLEPWKETYAVNHVDAHLAPFLTADWYRGKV